MKTLVIGCDASGKTTTLESIKTTWNDSIGESTQSVEAKLFKAENYERPIDEEYINLREQLYLKLSGQALLAMQNQENVVSSDSSLVTRVSHSAMRSVISAPSLNNNEIIELWKEDERAGDDPGPDIIVFTHANIDTIRDRMLNRQATGDKYEKFWGFNSMIFLQAYQERWHSVIADIGKTAQKCITFNTSTTPTETFMEEYNDARNNIIKNTA